MLILMTCRHNNLTCDVECVRVVVGREDLATCAIVATSFSSPKACARIHRPRFLLIVSSYTRTSHLLSIVAYDSRES